MFKDLFSLLPCPLSLQAFKTSCLSFQLHCFWQNSYFHICQRNYIPSCLCFTSKRSIIRPMTLDLFSLLFLLFGLFPDFRLCHSVFRHVCVCVCVRACVQGACVVGGFGNHKVANKFRLANKLILRKYGNLTVNSSRSPSCFIVRNFTFCTQRVFMCFLRIS